MQLVLLSGGSGKRLWPLSNDVRSKQFIPFFKNEHGEYKSMVQRVFSQIRKANPEVHVTITTNSAQKSAIVNQLGEAVSVCVEPERRDTFPAIGLASEYLKDELHTDLDETVVVCPVDPYVDQSYFESLMKLDQYVQANSSNLTLMGIEPTYPSEKYGYIIPKTTSSISGVSEFKEKPDKVHAQSFIEQGALWNAGIFAFKLRYLLDIVEKESGLSTYEQVKSCFSDLTKQSFDYAVVEKEPSIQVLRFAGNWRDVGTWNMITEVMDDQTKGRALLADTCKDTHIINELNIPILAMGCKNLVIAASGDGILVADKEQSGYMKPYVEKISSTVNFAEKSWGTFKVLDAHPGSLIVSLEIKQEAQLSYQSHEQRDETWLVLTGEGSALINGDTSSLRPGSVLQIPRGTKHSLKAITEMNVIETQIGNEISVEDKDVFPSEN
ncbi:sugar phosphate nucleotidyltransferase [Lactiplantibacillus plantarum]|uniref:sugar phosphate nucleotidyltransferase n=1 Tax=Lactiplantibacillus plantarum TaxID=1590 RepID=UPI0032E44681